MRKVLVGLLVIALGGTSCGGDDSPQAQPKLPDVTGKRVDIALSDLKRAGLAEETIEIVGGGSFGVLDKASWTVCDQDPQAGTRSSTVRILVDRACAAEDTFESGGAPKTPTDPNQPAPAGGPTATAAPMLTVPNVVGMNLQEAQDHLQSQGFYNVTSHDATGQSRYQVLDRNWKVCDQKPNPGTTAPSNTQIDLGAVTNEEQCP